MQNVLVLLNLKIRLNPDCICYTKLINQLMSFTKAGNYFIFTVVTQNITSFSVITSEVLSSF
jgi:hypothetical protein